MKLCTCEKWKQNKKEWEDKDISNCPYCGKELIQENNSNGEETLILG
jgi:wobble nucleotide-excising tRNase